MGPEVSPVGRDYAITPCTSQLLGLLAASPQRFQTFLVPVSFTRQSSFRKGAATRCWQPCSQQLGISGLPKTAEGLMDHKQGLLQTPASQAQDPVVCQLVAL